MIPILGNSKCSKVVFLDIDGVLCTHRTMTPTKAHNYDPVGIMLLKKLFEDHPGWEIVMSSTWRLFGGAGAILRSHGLMNTHRDESTGVDEKMRRSKEIQAWLDKHPEVKHYIIVDDEKSDITGIHLKYLVQTSMYDGILFEHYQQMDRMMTDVARLEAKDQDQVK